MAIREIRCYQKSTELLLRTAPCAKLVRAIACEFKVVPWLQYPGRLVTVPSGKAAPIRDFQRQVTHWGLEPARRQDELW